MMRFLKRQGTSEEEKARRISQVSLFIGLGDEFPSSWLVLEALTRPSRESILLLSSTQ
jgi:hypothetical protein